MPRRPRSCPPGIPQHIIQRGNNRQPCFTSDPDMGAYAHWLHEAAIKYGVHIHAWVFMSNHVHLLATPDYDHSTSSMMQHIGRRYVRYFNHAHERTGSLWEGRFKSCSVLNDTYLLVCQRYIELNPVRAHMTSDPADYKWSSYRANGLGIASKLRTPHALYLGLGSTKSERQCNYRSLFHSHVDKKLLIDIRTAINTGSPL